MFDAGNNAPWDYLQPFKDSIYYDELKDGMDSYDGMNRQMLGFYIWLSKDKRNIKTTIVLVFQKKDVPYADQGKKLLMSFLTIGLQDILNLFHFTSGQNFEAQFHLGEVDTCEADGKYIVVIDEDGTRFYLRPEKLLLHRNVPELGFKKPANTRPTDWEMTNPGLWSSLAFWPFCRKTAAKDIHNFANMTTHHVSQIDPPLVDRIPVYKKSEAPLVVLESKQTLGSLVSNGELWWAPRPLKAYKSPDGFDLNLAVLQAMRVSIQGRFYSSQSLFTIYDILT